MPVRLAFVVSLVGYLFSQAQADFATDFGVFSASNVTLKSYSVSNGDIYAGGNLTAEFGYGIQRPTANLGNMYAFGDYIQGSLSEVKGNVVTNGNATLTGSAKIFGDLTYGGTIARDNSTQITGATTVRSNLVPAIPLPLPTIFSAGTSNLAVSTDYSLLPGSYRDFSVTQSNRSITLTSGDYYMKSLTFSTSTKLNLQLTGAQPIRVFIQQDANFGTGLQFAVNGIDVGGTNPSFPRSLASQVLFESHSDVIIPAGFNSEFFGTIFTPFGGVSMSLQDMHGSIISALPVDGNVYLDYQRSALVQSVPEPTTAVLVSIGIGCLLWTRRRV